MWRVEPDLDTYPKTLNGSAKFNWFYDQLGLSEPARLKITKAIIVIAAVHSKGCLAVNGSLLRIAHNHSNTIIFAEADRKYPFPTTNRCMSQLI